MKFASLMFDFHGFLKYGRPSHHLNRLAVAIDTSVRTSWLTIERHLALTL